MSNLTLRSQMIRLAHSNPAMRPHLLPLLKLAVAADTSAFAEWVANTYTEIWDEGRVKGFLEHTLGVEVKPPTTRRSGPRFQKGDRVSIQKEKHKDAATIAPYVEFHGKIGTVVEVDDMDALVKLDSVSGPAVRFPNAQKKMGVGIMKLTEPYDMVGSKKIEMIYLAGGQATEEQKLVVDAYMGRAREGEKRSMTYYSGHVFGASTNAAGQLYFAANPQQRVHYDPASEAGYPVRYFNPTSGKVLYMGLFGHRPANWEEQLKSMREQASPV